MADTSAAHYQNLANQESANYNNAISQKAAIDAQISRLETAKTNLTNQINSFQTDIVDKMDDIKGDDDSQFKGNRRNKYTEQHTAANTAATTNKSSHDTNLTSITNKITELQGQSASLQATADTAYNNMVSYQASANAATE